MPKSKPSPYPKLQWFSARYASALSCGHSPIRGEACTLFPPTGYTRCNECSHAKAQEERLALVKAQVQAQRQGELGL